MHVQCICTGFCTFVPTLVFIRPRTSRVLGYECARATSGVDVVGPLQYDPGNVLRRPTTCKRSWRAFEILKCSGPPQGRAAQPKISTCSSVLTSALGVPAHDKGDRWIRALVCIQYVCVCVVLHICVYFKVNNSLSNVFVCVCV